MILPACLPAFVQITICDTRRAAAICLDQIRTAGCVSAGSNHLSLRIGHAGRDSERKCCQKVETSLFSATDQACSVHAKQDWLARASCSTGWRFACDLSQALPTLACTCLHQTTFVLPCQ